MSRAKSQTKRIKKQALIVLNKPTALTVSFSSLSKSWRKWSKKWQRWLSA